MPSTPEQRDQSYLVFNEGVSLSVEAADAAMNGNREAAADLNKGAIQKFREALNIAPDHALAPGALAQSLYMGRQYKEAISWFEKAIAINPSLAANHRGLGLCQISLGDLPKGKLQLEKAFELAPSEEARSVTVEDLLQMGLFTFQYAEDNRAQLEAEDVLSYQRYAVGVLMMAHEFDDRRTDIAQQISRMGARIGDRRVEEYYREQTHNPADSN